jgi:hypothetical protein
MGMDGMVCHSTDDICLWVVGQGSSHGSCQVIGSHTQGIRQPNNLCAKDSGYIRS